MNKLSGLLLILILILTACESHPYTPFASPLAVSPLLPAAQPAHVIIVYERSGGIAGRRDTWRFYSDGRIEALSADKPARELELPASTVQAAFDTLSAKLADLEDSYLPLNECCDLYTYRLTIIQTSKVKSVVTMDGATRPPALAEAMVLVNDLIQQAQSKQ